MSNDGSERSFRVRERQLKFLEKIFKVNVVLRGREHQLEQRNSFAGLKNLASTTLPHYGSV